ncbi:MAG: exodeoxyribonuclease III [Thermodesulfobacteriaceae bacterium]|nr:exodeoxyribonuclease III [Thermodesulfobacteriaceae bacterium]MCX8042085.1 exodeoxyribonuclease III [Thermodesulfobacteriaceae bacterium]MDW8135885.1 exodeoxyribonuclease III [Thermodesulfobacterium sp.]
MIIGSWNVNSIKVRLDQVISLLEKYSLDLLAIQETKVKTENFPYGVFEKLGYEVYHQGGKGKNGVAIISKLKAKEVKKGFEGLEERGDFPDAKERILGIKLSFSELSELWFFSCYIPNGSPVNSDYYFYKLQFLWQLKEYLETYFSKDTPLILSGDFNVAPSEIDVYEPTLLEGSICFTEKERKVFLNLLEFGLKDALRVRYPEKRGLFTWWDYQFSAFEKNLGMRLDHILITSSLIARLEEVWIDRQFRALKKPSDHAPILAKFKI